MNTAPRSSPGYEKLSDSGHLIYTLGSADTWACSASFRHRMQLIAHDLKTPMQALLLLADGLAASDPTRTALIKSMRACIGQMAGILGRFQPWSADEPHTPYHRLKDAVDEVLALHEHSHRLRIDIGPGTGDIPLPEHELFTVLQNLITNSIRYGGRTIRLCRTESADAVSLHYHDGGAGIPQRIWDTLELQEPPMTRQGRGQGLWLVNRMLLRYGGQLHPDDEQIPGGIRLTFQKSALPPMNPVSDGSIWAHAAEPKD